MMISAFLTILALSGWRTAALSGPGPLAAAALHCGTSPETQQRAEAVARRLAHRPSAKSGPYTRVADDTIFVRADEVTTPFDDPVDLEGITLNLTRRDDVTFAVARAPLAYDDDIGPLFVAFNRTVSAKELPLTKFAFPFGGVARTKMTLSVARGIHFEEKPAIPPYGFRALDYLFSQTPLISPHLDTQFSHADRPFVYVKETADAVTITWRSQSRGGTVDYDMQAVLFAGGDIRFSYKLVQNMAWGGVVVTTGSDAWRSQRAKLAAIFDPTGDAAEPMQDITSLEVSRVAASSLLELRFHLAAPLDRSKLDGTSYLAFLGNSSGRVELWIDPTRLRYSLPGAAELIDSPAARIEGSEVILYVDENLLELQSRNMQVWAYTNARGMAVDALTATVSLGDPAPAVETDFSALTALETARPLVETYRLPHLNVYGVWSRMQAELGLRDDAIDAVAIFPSFFTDIIDERYGAFATLANPGADGISQFSNSANPRTPTLIHMNSTFAFTGAQRTEILLHELGHRWLYYFDLREDGQNRRVLNPLGYHPAQWVHTPAAFPVMSANDSSAMGGGIFLPGADGTFSTMETASRFGFTWHELYLMGLARAEEVPSWFYLRDSGLGGEYFPPLGVTVNATRTDVTVQQIIDAMGPRHPPFESSQKELRVLFVVLERTPGSAAPIDAASRTQFENAFRDATGGRGRVVTTLQTTLPPPRRRAVR